MRTVAICNKKGGVGKTTTTYNLSAGLSKLGYKVLALDLDPQCSLTQVTGFNQDGPTTNSVIFREVKIENAIINLEFFDFIPGSPLLEAADKSLPEGINRLMRLREPLGRLKDRYDYCIIDNAPAMGVVATNAIMAADYVIIPAEANALSTDGIVKVYESLLDAKKYVNPDIRIAGILLTRYKPNTILAREYEKIFSGVAKEMGTKVFKTKIRENINLSELSSIHIPIYDYRPKSTGAEDYMAFTKEFAGGVNRSESHRQK